MPLRIIPDKIKTTVADIAPCGMNCRVCYASMRERGNPCPGCLGGEKHMPQSCLSCRIRNCEELKGNVKYCFTCNNFPCTKLKQLDARYRKKYGMSMIENLQQIRQSGIREFVRNENLRWICTECGNKLCVHRADCPSCGHSWRK